MTPDALRWRAVRAYRLEAGRCLGCGRVREDERYRSCVRCRASSAARVRRGEYGVRLRAARLAANRCVRCGGADPQWAEGLRRFKHCRECRTHISARMRAVYRRKQREGVA